MDLLVEDVVSLDFLAVAPDDTIEHTIRLMHERRSSSAVVMDNGIPVGIVTERDAIDLLLETFGGTSWKDLSVRHIMTSPVVAVCDDYTVLEALSVARGGKIRHIPVIDAYGKIAGVLNQGRMLEVLYEYIQNNMD